LSIIVLAAMISSFAFADAVSADFNGDNEVNLLDLRNLLPRGRPRSASQVSTGPVTWTMTMTWTPTTFILLSLTGFLMTRRQFI